MFGADQMDISLYDDDEVDDNVVDVGKDDVRDDVEGEPADDFIVEFDNIGHQGDDE